MNKPTKQAIQRMRTVYFHEDDYGQCEVLPLADWGWCAGQMERSIGFAEEHRTPYGFTDVYRIDHSEMLPLGSLGLTPERLERVLSFLPPFDRVESGYATERREVRNVWARGMHDRMAVYGSIDDAGTVKNLWLASFGDLGEADRQLLGETLRALGTVAPVLLADWGRSCCVDLTRNESVDRYLQVLQEE